MSFCCVAISAASNAVPQPMTAMISAASGEAVTIEVLDTGIGMSPEQLARVLKPFEQGDGSVTRKYGGTGLGLTITQQIVRLLGGDIAIGSALNRGTSAKLRLRADLDQFDSAA